MAPETTFDFGNGSVPAHRHQNPDGTLGGWVADSATVATTAWVGVDARVDVRARVGANARVGAGARVDEDARVGEYTWVGVGARVGAGARVGEDAGVGTGARVGEYARVGTGARVGDWGIVNGDDILTGHLGGHYWTIYRTGEGWHIQYGREVRPLAWWRKRDLQALSMRHGHPADHSRFTAAVLGFAEILAATPRS